MDGRLYSRLTLGMFGHKGSGDFVYVEGRGATNCNRPVEADVANWGGATRCNFGLCFLNLVSVGIWHSQDWGGGSQTRGATLCDKNAWSFDVIGWLPDSVIWLSADTNSVEQPFCRSDDSKHDYLPCALKCLQISGILWYPPSIRLGLFLAPCNFIQWKSSMVFIIPLSRHTHTIPAAACADATRQLGVHSLVVLHLSYVHP